VHDLGRPERFLNMLRVVKPTSPMSIGSWLLAGYAPLALAAAASDVTGVLSPVGAAATLGAAGAGCAVATYTGALIANTAVPAWHESRAELPLLFAASAAASAGGAGLLAGAGPETAPARRVAVVGAVAELALEELMVRRLPTVIGRSYHEGRAARQLRLGKALTVAGAVTALVGRRSRVASIAAGAALLGASALTRFGIFHAGVESAQDPDQTVVPQRARQDADGRG
jgi:formate-dependent nitrite reductase membrane component NrfD